MIAVYSKGFVDTATILVDGNKYNIEDLYFEADVDLDRDGNIIYHDPEVFCISYISDDVPEVFEDRYVILLDSSDIKWEELEISYEDDEDDN